MGWTVGVLRALVDLWCFNLYLSEFLCSDLVFFSSNFEFIVSLSF